MAIINGTPGNDFLTGTSAADTFTGLAGIDTAQVAAPSREAVFRLDAQGRWVVASPQGTDTLDNMEAVQFADGSVTLSGEVRVNTTTDGSQTSPVISALSNGGFVVTWLSRSQDGSSSSLYSQRFDASGRPLGAETRVNTTAGFVQDPSVAVLKDDGYVVIWKLSGLADTLSGLYSQRFDASGSPLGPEASIRAGTSTASPNQPVIAGLDDGGYVVAWWTSRPQVPDWTMEVQRFDGSGSPVGSSVQVSQFPYPTFQLQPSIDSLEGGYVVTWMSLNGERGGSGPDSATGPGVFAQRFDANGTPIGDVTQVNTFTPNGQQLPRVTGLNDGGYVVAWMSNTQDGSGLGIYAQRFDAGGNRVGNEVRVNTTTAGNQSTPAITALKDGGYLVTWMSDDQDGSGYGIYAQRFDAAGNRVGGETQINTTTASEQQYPVVSPLDDGGYVVAWTSYAQDGSGYGVYAQRFDSSGTALSGGAALLGDGRANTLQVDTSRAVELSGMGGDDVLQGGSGNDVLNGGEGWDTVVAPDSHRLLTWELTPFHALRMSGPAAGTDLLQSIERVQAAGASIEVQGGAGAERQINTTPITSPGETATVTLNDGGYVVVWTAEDDSLSGLYARRFDAAGTPLGNEARVNTTTQNGQGSPVVTALGSGGYVVAWASYLQDSSDYGNYGVYAQRFDASGTPAGSETRVNTTTAGSQLAPAITTLSTGYVVTWVSSDVNGSGYGIYAQRFDETGMPLGSETKVNTTPSVYQSSTMVTALEGGDYVVAWMSLNQEGRGDIYAQRFDTSGVRVGAETRVSTAVATNAYSPAIAALEDGGYAVTWTAIAQDDSSGWDIRAQRFDAAGNRLGSETQVNTVTTGLQEAPVITGLSDGGYVVVWRNSYNQDGSGYGLNAQRFDANGLRTGSEVGVTSTTAGDQWFAAVTALNDGGYLVTWTSEAQDGSGYGVYSQRFDSNNLREGHLLLTGGAEDNVLRMTSAIEGVGLTGGAGQDALAGASGWDVLTGGSGADTFEFAASNNGVDLITDWGNGDRISIAGATFTGPVTQGNGSSVALNAVQASTNTNTGVTTLFIGTDAAPGADVVVRLAGSFAPDGFTLQGNLIQAPTGVVVTGLGSLVGSAGDDTLIAQRGITRLEGGAGNDIYIIANPNDRLIERSGGGMDEVRSEGSYTLADNLERLLLTGERASRGTGNDLDNAITGNSARNVLTGGLGADLMTGGAGADLFTYRSASDSGTTPGTWDTVLDFQAREGDRIDLRDIDAHPALPGEQGFTFIGTAEFSTTNATGQLRFDAAAHLLSASLDADPQAEMLIELVGVLNMSAGDFNL